MAVPVPEGARPVFADGKDRSSRGLSLRGPFFFLGVMFSNFDLSVRLGKGTEQKITTKPVGVDALGDPKTMEFDLFYGYMQTNSLKKFINFKIIKSFVSGRRGRRPLPVTENSILHGQT